MPRLTVGLPVYNAMPHLPETVESLLSQTMEDFELFVIDDGSTDESSTYLQSLDDKRLRIVTQTNRGLSATLNQMLRQSASPWHVRHDADDVARPDRLQRVVDAVEQWPDAGMFYSRAGQIPHAPGRHEFRTTVGDPSQLRAITRSGYILAICHPTVVLNVEKTLSVGGYRTNLLASQDQDLWWRMALRHDIRFIDAATLDYRMTAAGLSNSSLLRQVTESLFVQYELLSELWGLRPLAFAEVSPALQTMIDVHIENSRGHLRSAAINYGNDRLLAAAYHASCAILRAPSYVISRVARRGTGAHLPEVTGIDPMEFLRHRESFWPHECFEANWV